MVHMNSHEEWVDKVSGGASRRQVATAIGVSQSTYNRQANAGRFDAETIIAIARHYRVQPVAALAALEILTNEEAAGMTAHAIAGLLTDQQLIRELARRVDSDEAAWEGTFDDVVESATVTAGPWSGVSHVPDNVAAHTSDEKGYPDYIAPGEGTQIDPNDP